LPLVYRCSAIALQPNQGLARLASPKKRPSFQSAIASQPNQGLAQLYPAFQQAVSIKCDRPSIKTRSSTAMPKPFELPVFLGKIARISIRLNILPERQFNFQGSQSSKPLKYLGFKLCKYLFAAFKQRSLQDLGDRRGNPSRLRKILIDSTNLRQIDLSLAASTTGGQIRFYPNTFTILQYYVFFFLAKTLPF
jgi:hypothetical protein